MKSPPLREILPALEKPSQNQIAEILYKTLAWRGQVSARPIADAP
jgi:D-alanyl-D-alanine carboxypeptidase